MLGRRKYKNKQGFFPVDVAQGHFPEDDCALILTVA